MSHVRVDYKGRPLLSSSLVAESVLANRLVNQQISLWREEGVKGPRATWHQHPLRMS